MLWRIPISKLSLPLISIVIPNLAFSNDKNEKTDVVVVTASGYEQKIIDAAASINVITQQDLARRNYNDLAEALYDIEGLDIRGTTGKTGGLDIRIRGMRSQDTLILVDGLRQNGTQDVTPNGFATMNTSFIPPLAAIERIEVIRGPMSTLYGSDAIGGVINIITKKTSPVWVTSLTLDHTFQEHRAYGDTSTISLYTTGPLIDNRLGLALRGSGLSRAASNAVSSNTGRELNTRGPNPVKANNYDLGAKFTLSATSNHTLWLDNEIARQTYDNSEGQLGSLTGGYEPTLHYNRNKITIGHEGILTLGTWSSSLGWNQTETIGRTIPIASLSQLANRNLANTSRELKSTDLIFDTKLISPVGENHILNVGGQYLYEEMKDGIVLANQGSKFEQKTWALFAEDEWRIIEPIAFTYGARYGHNQFFGSQISPRAYLVWSIFDSWTIKGGVSTGYKAPTLAQTHNGISGIVAQGRRITLGNSDLKPERSVNKEIGFYYQHLNGFSADTTFFHNDLKDIISSQQVICTTTANCVPGFPNLNTYTHSINLDKAISQGIEMGSTLPLTANWDLKINYTYTETEQKGRNQGAKLSNTPRHMVNSSLYWQATPNLTTWLKMEYRSDMPRFITTYTNLSADDKIVYDNFGDTFSSYTVWQLGSAYAVSNNVTLNASINNLLDKNFTETYAYLDSNGVESYIGKYFASRAATTGSIQPGRNFWISINVDF